MIKNNFRKIDIAKNLSNKMGFSISISKKIVDDFILIILENIKKGNFILKNIGSFNLIYKKDRIGRNPKTNEEYLISQRKSISFKASQNLRDLLNE